MELTGDLTKSQPWLKKISKLLHSKMRSFLMRTVPISFMKNFIFLRRLFDLEKEILLDGKI